MEPTIFDGDFILICKLRTNKRSIEQLDLLRQTICSIQTRGLFEPYATRINSKSTQHRLSGFLEVGDIIVAEYPNKKKKFIVKKILAMPGDTVYLDSTGFTYNRSKYLTFGTANDLADSAFLNNLNKVKAIETIDNNLVYLFCHSIFFNGKSWKKIDNSIPKESPDIMRGLSEFVGDMIVPSKFMKPDLSNKYSTSHEYLLNCHEGIFINHLESENSSFGIDNTSQCFKRDYFYVIGDNFYESQDSRFFGCLPEDYIAGKVIAVFSFN